MTDYDLNDVQDMLDEKGELILVLDSDAYAEPIELHRHDTTFRSDDIQHFLSDGSIRFKPSSIESITWHEQSTGDLGL